MQKGKLYLIPNSLGSDTLKQTHADGVLDIVNEIDHYIVENIGNAAKFLKLAGLKKSLHELTFYVLNVNSTSDDISGYLEAAEGGLNMGLISEAGVPCVADPGAVITAMAHEKGISIIPLTGPSSILLALMASGLNGQNFAFNGYLPIDSKQRMIRLKELVRRIRSEDQTQVFIEAPHRNDKLLEELVNNLDGNLRLCIAIDLTMDSEKIITKTIADWKSARPLPGKNPAIFLLGK
jgi:16S rRNA (cytidine1402-2'-O)-methyltransferase